MKRKIISLLLILSMIAMLLSDIAIAVGTETVPDCSCGNKIESLTIHADGCARKAYCREISVKSAKELFDMWGKLPMDVRDFVLTYLSWTNWQKLQELNELLKDFKEEEEPDEQDHIEQQLPCADAGPPQHILREGGVEDRAGICAHGDLLKKGDILCFIGVGVRQLLSAGSKRRRRSVDKRVKILSALKSCTEVDHSLAKHSLNAVSHTVQSFYSIALKRALDNSRESRVYSGGRSARLSYYCISNKLILHSSLHFQSIIVTFAA